MRVNREGEVRRRYRRRRRRRRQQRRICKMVMEVERGTKQQQN